MVDMSVTLADVDLPNPLMTASGCAANGKELHRFFDVSTLGAFVTKSVMAAPRARASGVWSGMRPLGGSMMSDVR